MSLMTKEVQLNGCVELADIKPEVSNAIFFPISVVHENLDKYHGDARSFGYHQDEGTVTIVTYEQVVGVLAEDTIALYDECALIKKHLSKPHHSMLDVIDCDVEVDLDNAQLLICYDDERFYKDDAGYFFTTPHYCHGKPQRVSTETAEIYREVNFEYQRQVKQYNVKMTEAIGNMKILRETL